MAKVALVCFCLFLAGICLPVELEGASTSPPQESAGVIDDAQVDDGAQSDAEFFNMKALMKALNDMMNKAKTAAAPMSVEESNFRAIWPNGCRSNNLLECLESADVGKCEVMGRNIYNEAAKAGSASHDCCLQNCPREFAPPLVLPNGTVAGGGLGPGLLDRGFGRTFRARPIFGCVAPKEYIAANAGRASCGVNMTALTLAYTKWCYCQTCWKCFDYDAKKFRKGCDFRMPYVYDDTRRSVLQPMAPEGWCKCRMNKCGAAGQRQFIIQRHQCLPVRSSFRGNCYLNGKREFAPDLEPIDCHKECKIYREYRCDCTMEGGTPVFDQCIAGRGFEWVCPKSSDFKWAGGMLYNDRVSYQVNK